MFHHQFSGEEFGSNGFGWISYELMEQGVNEACDGDHAATLPELARGEYFTDPMNDMAQIDSEKAMEYHY